MRKLVVTTFFLLYLFSFQNILGYSELTQPEINAKSAFLFDVETNTVLYEKNIDDKIYPASTTKILTAILAIEKLDLNESSKVSQTAINALPKLSSTVNLQVGEVIRNEDLLYCLLLRSGNDAALVLAEAISGSIENFTKEMNKKALELSCTSTNFTNPHGFHNDNHYSTPRDMMKILAYCMKSQKFSSIISTKSYTVPTTNKHASRNLLNTNKLLRDSDFPSYVLNYQNGGKTGYTPEGGQCLVSYANNNGQSLLCAVFDAPVINKDEYRFIYTKTLFEYGFNNFENVVILPRNSDLLLEINETNLMNKTYSLKNDIKVSVPIRTKYNNYELINIKFLDNSNTEISNIQYEIKISGLSTNLDGITEIYNSKKTLVEPKQLTFIEELYEIVNEFTFNIKNTAEKVFKTFSADFFIL
ncbi:MAG: D-alanyl-D-alanine carboxypeptidase [Clostridia bacterium]